MTYTRGHILQSSIAFALVGVKLHLGRRFVPVRLTEEQRYDIAEQVVLHLRKYGDTWKLDEQASDYRLPPSER